MKPINLLITGISLTFLLGSCTVYKDIPIEVLQTEEVKIPSSGRNFAFVYRNFKFTNDTLQNYYLKNGELVRDMHSADKDIDSILVSDCLNSAANAFVQNRVGSNSVILPFGIMPRQTGEKIHPLPAGLVRKLAQSARADYLLFLETLTYFFSRYTGENRSETFQQVNIAGIWSLYNAETGEIEDRKSMVDTIYWSHNENTDRLSFPPRLESLRQASSVFGETYAKRYYAGWITVNRLLIVPPLEEFRVAAEYAAEQDWDNAVKIWQRYSGDRMGRLAVTARYNLALAAEISDDLEAALDWAKQAYILAKKFNNRNEIRMILEYKSLLTKRMTQIEKISTSPATR